MKGNAVIGQSGGPTAVINQSLVGVIQEIRRHSHIGELLGARHGVRGIVKGDFLRLNDASDELLERIAQTPCSALGSTRDKPDREYCARIFEQLKQFNVHYFFYIGGNDSSDSARIIFEMAQAEGYDLRTFHIPKTIDNDLRVHDHTPGFGSAARFVASAFIGDDYDNKSLPGIKINVLMGRDAGFLTASSVLGRRYPNDGPHLVYVPEAPISEEKLVADVRDVYNRLGRCVLAVSEGIRLPGSPPVRWAEHIQQDLERDAHGNVQLSGSGALADYIDGLLTRELTEPGGPKLRIRADTFGYLQRSFADCVSPVDAAEARRVGVEAVRYSSDPSLTQGSVYMTCQRSPAYSVEYGLTDLKNVARIPKEMPEEYINSTSNGITPAFLEYARPLVGDLPVVGSFEELG